MPRRTSHTAMVRSITSVHNERVKYIRALARRRFREEEQRFVVEGTHLIDEVGRAGIEPALVFFTEAWAARPEGQRLLPALVKAREGAWQVPDEVLAACADTTTPQGVLAVLPFLSIPARLGLLLVLDGLRDPGNLGTILRSAEAAGVGRVLLGPGTVDLYNPKVVRAAMGAHLRLSSAAADWPTIARRLEKRAAWLADVHGQVAYDEVDWTQPSALIVGGEVEGTSREAAELAGARVTIPMSAGPDSLNAAMATTVLVFEAARQLRRKQASGSVAPG